MKNPRLWHRMADKQSAGFLLTAYWRQPRWAHAAISLALSLMAFATLPSAMCLLAIVILLVAASLVDLAAYRIPDAITLPLIILAATSANTEPDERILGLVCAPLLLWLVRLSFLKAKGYHGLGFGDVKLIATSGALVGIAQVGLLLFCSASLALLVAALWHSRHLHGQSDRRHVRLRLQPIAFGPFIVCATFIIMLCQQEGLLS